MTSNANRVKKKINCTLCFSALILSRSLQGVLGDLRKDCNIAEHTWNLWNIHASPTMCQSSSFLSIFAAENKVRVIMTIIQRKSASMKMLSFLQQKKLLLFYSSDNIYLYIVLKYKLKICKLKFKFKTKH